MNVNGQSLVYDHYMLSIISPVKSEFLNSLHDKLNVLVTNYDADKIQLCSLATTFLLLHTEELLVKLSR